MAKQTLLDIVQDILSDADGDEVNSIADTIEAEQCARVVRDAYLQITDLHDFQSVETIAELDATGASTPTVLTRPVGFHSIDWIKYDVRLQAGDAQKYRTLTYLSPTDFLDKVFQRNTGDTKTDVMTFEGVPIPIYNDRAPQYYTVMDSGDDSIVCDAYDSSLETNLQQSKNVAYGTQKPDLVLADTTTMSIPQHLETLVKRTARAMYFDLYKDGITSEIDRTRRRAEVRAQRHRHMIKNTDNNRSPNYGRK